MPNNRVLAAFAIAAGIVVYCAFATLLVSPKPLGAGGTPREINFTDRYPVQLTSSRK